MTPVQALEGSDYDLLTFTIANGASLSDGQTFEAGEPVAIELPTLTNAAISFQVSYDGGTTYRDLYNSDGTTETSLGASTGARICPVPAALKEAGAVALKVRSGLTGAAVNQGAERSIKILLQRLQP